MSKRLFLLLLIIFVLAIGVGVTSLESSSIQSSMNEFEESLTSDTGISSTINNSSTMSAVALKLQSLIDGALNLIVNFSKKVISLFI